MKKALLLITSLGLVTSSFAGAVTYQAIAKPVLPVLARSQVVGAVSTSDVLDIAVSLKPNTAALQAFVDSVSNPASPQYRKFITPDQVGQKFGASVTDQTNVINYLKSKGLTITLAAPNRMAILARGTVGQIQNAFNTQIKMVQGPDPEGNTTITFRANTTPLQLPSNIANVVIDVSNVESYTRPKPRATTSTLTPFLTRSLYKLQAAFTGGFHGEGRTMAISNFDGYRLSNLPLLYSTYSLPVPSGGVGSNVQVIVVGSPTGTGTPGGEGDLDIQMELAVAPLATMLIYDGSDLVPVLTREGTDNRADVTSESYGWNLDSATATAAHNQHLAMNAQGMTYMEATGDNGTTIEPYSYSNYEPEVLQVGGSIATVDSASGVRNGEVGWSGSGGGYVTKNLPFNKLPSWQKGNGVPTNINYRLNPDIAMHASGTSAGAYFFVFNGSLNNGFDGTSMSSPTCTGGFIILEQRLAAAGLPFRLGRVSDLIYTQNGRSDIWFDMVSGANGTLPNGQQSTCKPGWDFVTGWGAPNYDALYNAIATGGTNNTATDMFPASINTTLGDYISGDETSVAASDNTYYRIETAFTGQVGQIAAAEATWVIPTNVHPLDKLNTLSLSVEARGANRASGSLFLWNWTLNRYELVNSFSMTTADKTTTLKIASPTKYVDGGGNVKALIRGLNPVQTGRMTTAPLPFELDLDLVKLSATYTN